MGHLRLSHLDKPRPRKPSGHIWGQLAHWLTVHWLPFPLASSFRGGTELFVSMSLPHAGLSKCLQRIGAQVGCREWQYLKRVLGRPVLCHAILIPATVHPPLSTNHAAYSPSHLLTTHCENFEWLITKPKRGECNSPTAKRNGHISLSLWLGPPLTTGRLSFHSLSLWFWIPLPILITHSFYVASDFLLVKQM